MDGFAPAGGPLPGGDWPQASASAQIPAAGPAAGVPGDDFDLDEHFAWLVAEIEAGRVQAPPEPAIGGPAVSVSLGDACDVDPELLAAMCGPDGLGGQAVSAMFGQDKAADALRPGPVLAALTAQAVSSPASLSDDELVGALQAGRRLANLADYQQTVVIAEFARRRQAAFAAAKAAGKPAGCRDGEFPGAELAMELIETGPCTSLRIDTALELTARLPRTLAGMAEGRIDLGRAMIIAARTLILTGTDAACADQVLAAAAPGLRPDQLAGKAARLEMKLAPQAVAARKERLRREEQRVEVRREESGNASLAGRELAVADAMASKAYLDAIAARLRNSGLVAGTLGHLRTLALTDLTQGRNPLDRIRPAEAPAQPQSPARATAGPGLPDQHAGEAGDSARRGPARPGGTAPLPALVNLLVPAATALGWGTAPATAAGWGLLDPTETRAVLQAAARHPRTRWCMTVTAPDGTALAHGCAAGQHPWPPGNLGPPGDPTGLAGPGSGAPPHRSDSPGSPDPGGDPGPGGHAPAAPPPQAAQLLDLIRQLNITLEPVARDACDHASAEDRYTPSRKLQHLLRARHHRCTAPGCNNQAVFCDLDHTVPYPGGPTCQCNLNPKCRRHHRTKQAPGVRHEVAHVLSELADWRVGPCRSTA